MERLFAVPTSHLEGWNNPSATHMIREATDCPSAPAFLRCIQQTVMLKNYVLHFLLIFSWHCVLSGRRAKPSFYLGVRAKKWKY